MKKDIIARTAANTLINHDKPNQGNTEANLFVIPQYSNIITQAIKKIKIGLVIKSFTVCKDVS